MSLLALGINHDSAPVAVRERLALAGTELPDVLRVLRGQPGVRGAALVSTCNRTELYCRTETGAEETVRSWLQHFAEGRSVRVAPHLYQHRQDAAVRHAFRVATGLDSLVLGEPQILGQMKTAWRVAQQTRSLEPTLDRLFQQAFAVAKQVRAQTGLGEGAVSVAYAGIKLTRQVFADLPERQVLILGAGETATLVGRHLKAAGVRRITVLNRTLPRARRLAADLLGRAVGLDRLEEELPHADLVVGATAAGVLDLAAYQRALRGRRRRLMLMLDLGVPRAIDPALADLDDVILYDIDHLRQIAEDGSEQRRVAAIQAEAIVHAGVDDFMRWWRGQDLSSPLKRLRAVGDAIREDSVAEAVARLRAGGDAAEVLQQLAHRLTGRLQHLPTLALREAIELGDEVALATLRRIYRLDE